MAWFDNFLKKANNVYNNVKWDIFGAGLPLRPFGGANTAISAKKPNAKEKKTFRKKFTRNTFIIEEEYIVRKKIINIFEEEEHFGDNWEGRRGTPVSNNNKSMRKQDKTHKCWYSCFHSRRLSEEEAPNIQTKVFTSKELQRSDGALNSSDLTCYTDLFRDKTDSTIHFLKRSTGKLFNDYENYDVEGIKRLSARKTHKQNALGPAAWTHDKILGTKASDQKELLIESLKGTDMENILLPKIAEKDSERSSKVDFENINVPWVNSHLQNERYICDSFIGKGTFGKVFSCTDISDENNKVAVKVNKKSEKYQKLAKHEIFLLNKVKKHDPKGRNCVVILKEWLMIDGHIVLVFPEYGENLYRYLKFNNHIGIHLDDVRKMSVQIWKAVTFLHSLTIVHTDIKPENLLLVSKDYGVSSSDVPVMKLKTKRKPEIVLIDLGNAVCGSDAKPKLIVTRYYRPPEVYLEIGWDHSVDVWSIGCVMYELYTGRSLFQCKSDNEHLWMMEKILKRFPDHMVQKSKLRDTHFDKDGNVVSENIDIYKLKLRLQTYEAFLQDKERGIEPFIDIIRRCLQYDPKERITTKEALASPFLS